MVALSNCTTKDDDVEVIWSPDVYVGKADKQAILRDSENPTEIKCEEKRFNDFLCVHAGDWERIYKLCLEAKDK